MQSFDTLLNRYLTGSISDEEREMLFSMVMCSPRCRESYEKAAKLNTLLRVPVFDSHLEADYRSLVRQRNLGAGRPRRMLAVLRRVAAAAVLVLVSSTLSVWLYSKSQPALPVGTVETSTPLGGQTRIMLPDGTVAWVNAKSELKYGSGFGSTDRNLTLEGEGYFEVAKDERLPFRVHAGKMTVSATGTRFNVRSYPDDRKWEVDLSEGGVDISVSGRSFSLSPDQRVVYDRDADLARVEQSVADLASRWTTGKISFHQASIPEIYRMLERHFDVRIEIGSEELKKEYFLGSINLDMSLSAILSYLDIDKKYRVTLRDSVIVVDKKNS